MTLAQFRAQFRHQEVPPYRPPLTDLRIVEPTGSPTPVSFITWPPNRLRWVAELDPMPAGVAVAIDRVHAVLGETFTLDERIPPLPSLRREAEQLWRADRSSRIRQATVGVQLAVREAAPALYAETGEAMAAAVEARDDDAYAAAAALARHLRGHLSRLEGQGTKPRPEALPVYAVEWVLGAPDQWHADGRSKLTATTLNQHPEWRPGNYLPHEVLDNLVRLRARRA